MKNLYTNAAVLAVTVMTLAACSHSSKPASTTNATVKAAAKVDCSTAQSEMDALKDKIATALNTAIQNDSQGQVSPDPSDLRTDVTTLHTKFQSCSISTLDQYATDEIGYVDQIDQLNAQDKPASSASSSSSTASSTSGKAAVKSSATGK